MKNRKRVWVPLLVLLLVAAIWYSRPVTLPDLLKGQELQEINVLIRSLGDWTQEPDTATVSVPLTSPEGAALLEQLQDLSFCRSLTDPLIKPLAQAVNASHGSVSYESGDIRFEMDKLNFDWRVNQTQFKFIPGDIEISVKQQPDVIIKYIGGPLYVPPSADPDHEPIDVQA